MPLLSAAITHLEAATQLSPWQQQALLARLQKTMEILITAIHSADTSSEAKFNSLKKQKYQFQISKVIAFPQASCSFPFAPNGMQDLSLGEK